MDNRIDNAIAASGIENLLALTPKAVEFIKYQLKSFYVFGCDDKVLELAALTLATAYLSGRSEALDEATSRLRK